MNRVKYSLIYQFFAAQIQFGYYKTGDFLPSIEQLSQVYHAAPRTVRSAYLQLQEDGYVSLSSGRRTSVVYQSGPEACGRARRDYYLARRDAALALNEALKLLLLPLMREGCLRLSRRELLELGEKSAALEHGDFYISLIGGRSMILAAENRLALDLFDEVISFYQFPHTLLRLGDPNLPEEKYRALSRQAAQACGRGDREAFFRAYLQIQGFMNAVLRAYLAQAEREHPAPAQIAFDWGIYRARPQRCYTLAAQILREIAVSCAYAPGDALPHHAALADKHQVSYMTVRRTMKMLEALGAVCVRHGAGTTVARPRPDPAGGRDGPAGQIHAMARQAMQLLRPALDGLLSRFSPGLMERAQPCAALLRAQRANGLRYPAFLTCVDALLHGADPSMQAIWGRLSEVLLLDLPLLEARGGQGAGPDALIRCLEAGDARALAPALKEQMLQVCAAMEATGA